MCHILPIFRTNIYVARLETEVLIYANEAKNVNKDSPIDNKCKLNWFLAKQGTDRKSQYSRDQTCYWRSVNCINFNNENLEIHNFIIIEMINFIMIFISVDENISMCFKLFILHVLFNAMCLL